MYGGVTLHDNNRLTEEKKVPINLWLDGKQNTVPLETVKTNKKNVTVQELDLQARRYLQENIIYITLMFLMGRFRGD